MSTTLLVHDEVRTADRDRFGEDLWVRIQSRSIRCGVIGLGFIGSVLMNALIEAGFEARGFDRARGAPARFSRHRLSPSPQAAEHFKCDGDAAVLDDCDVIFVAVRNFVSDGVVDEEPLNSARDVIHRHRGSPCLVILESTVAPGTTRRFADALGARTCADLFVAHAPERLSAGQDHASLRATPHLVAGIDAHSTRLAAAVLGALCDRVVTVSAPEVSELSKLLENAFLSVNIGLTAEITRIAVGLGVQAHEVCQAAATKPHGFMAFYPGAGLGGHCLPNDLVLLAQSARRQGWEPEMLAGAISANESSPHVVVDRLARDLSELDIQLHEAHVLIVGVGFKPFFPDTTRSPAIEIVRELRRRGAEVSYVDSLNANFTIDEVAVRSVTPAALTADRFTAAIVLSGEEGLKDETLTAACSHVLDAGGSRLNRLSSPAIRML